MMREHSPCPTERAYTLQIRDGETVRAELSDNGTWIPAQDTTLPRAALSRTEAAVRLMEMSANAPHELFALVEIDPSRAPGEAGRVRTRVI